MCYGLNEGDFDLFKPVKPTPSETDTQPQPPISNDSFHLTKQKVYLSYDEGLRKAYKEWRDIIVLKNISGKDIKAYAKVAEKDNTILVIVNANDKDFEDGVTEIKVKEYKDQYGQKHKALFRVPRHKQVSREESQPVYFPSVGGGGGSCGG